MVLIGEYLFLAEGCNPVLNMSCFVFHFHFIDFKELLYAFNAAYPGSSDVACFPSSNRVQSVTMI